MQAISNGRVSQKLITLIIAGVVAAALGGGIALISDADGARGATTQQVKILGKNYLRLDAAPGNGNTKALLKLGKLHHRMKCTDLGGGSSRLDIQIRSLKPGGMMLARNGFVALTDTYQDVWFVFGSTPQGFAEGYDVLYRDGTYRHFELDFTVNHPKDCVARLSATTS